MNVAETLSHIEQLVRCLSASVTVDGDEEWTLLRQRLDELDAEAERCHLPTAKVREETGRLRHHLGAVLGKDDMDGHPRSQHLSWAYGAMQGLESDHCFGPVLPSLD